MKIKTILIFSFVFFNFYYAQAQEKQKQSNDSIKKKTKVSFRDPLDNAFDVSQFLLENKGVLFVPTLITEPALGYGGGGGLIYFHQRKKQYKSYVPPNLTGVIGLKTQNGTKGWGAFHMHTFGENRIKTMSVLMRPDIHIKYYGNNSELLNTNPILINLDSWFFLQRIQVRLASSNLYLGARYMYFNTTVGADTLADKPLLNEIIKRLQISSVISSIQPFIAYDTRDNIFTPIKGIYSELAWNHCAQWLGASDDFNQLRVNFLGFTPLNQKLYSAFRAEGQFILGDAPFYAFPSISLRGIPAMRYQSDNVLVLETELRYKFYNRFSIISFAGVGAAFKSINTIDNNNLAYSIGTGFRYEIARLLGIHMGADFAWGNGKDFAFYFVTGSAMK
jgi:hypothetical protein